MTLKEAILINEDPIEDNYYTRLAKIESGNNPKARAKTSSAAGLYQFTKPTWQGLTQQLGLNYSLDDRFDPVKSRKVVEEFTRKNKNYLVRKLGRKPNDAELYLAHFSGMGRAGEMLQVLQKNPNASVKDVFKSNQINANKSIFLNKDGSHKTVRDIYDWAAGKFDLDKFDAPIQKSTLGRDKYKDYLKEFQTVAIDNTKVARPHYKVPKLATPPINNEVTRGKLLKFDQIRAIDESRKLQEEELLKKYQVSNPNSQVVQRQQDLLYGQLEDSGFDPYNYIILPEIE